MDTDSLAGGKTFQRHEKIVDSLARDRPGVYPDSYLETT